MNKIIRKFFWQCAGVNVDLLEECKTDYSKYVAIGAAIFFTALFASLSGGYAMFYVFAGSDFALIFSIIFGVIWGLTIFNIDRFLVISLRKENKPLKEFYIALPRILLAIMIGIVIARPLELRIFQKEINDELKKYYIENKQQISKIRSDKFNAQFEYLSTELEEKKTQKEKAYKEWEKAKELRDTERFGTKTERTTGIRGWGPETDKLQAEVDRKQLIFDSLDIQVSRLENQLTQKRKETGVDVVEFLGDSVLNELVKNAGFYDRNKMLGRISSWTPLDIFRKQTDVDINNEPYKDKTVFFISLLIILIECLPIIVKLMSRRGDYDVRFETESDRNQFLFNQENLANKFLIKELSIAQREVLNEAISKWKDKEKSDSSIADNYISQSNN